MSGDQGSPESHGVYGGTPREDGKMQEEPSGTEGPASGPDGGPGEQTDSGGEVT